MDTLILFKRKCRVRIACSVTLGLVALLSACGGGGGGGSADLAASPVAANAPAAPMKPADAVPAGVAVLLLAAAACAGATCTAAPIDANTTLADASYSPYSPYPLDVLESPGYLVASTDVTATAGEPPYPDLRTLPTRVRPFQTMAFGDTSAFSVAPLR